MLRIRLSRVGKKNQPSYRVVVSERYKDPWGDHIEIVGFYDPLAKPKRVRFEKDRVLYWLSVGAQPTPTVHNLLVDAGVIDAKKVRATKGDLKARAQKEAEGEKEGSKQEGEERSPAADQKEEGQKQNDTPSSEEGEGEGKEDTES